MIHYLKRSPDDVYLKFWNAVIKSNADLASHYPLPDVPRDTMDEPSGAANQGVKTIQTTFTST